MTRPTFWLAGCLSIFVAVAQPLAAASPGSGMVVTGIVMGRSNIALVERDGQSYLVGVGDRIGDVTVVAISGTEVVFKQNKRTFALQVAHGAPPSATTRGGPPAVAISAATPAVPAATPVTVSPSAAVQPAGVLTSAVPQTASVTSVNLGATGYPTQTTVPVWGVPLAPAPSTPPVIPPGATLYTPSSTSAYGFTSAPITPQSVVTRDGISGLPVASDQVQSATQVTPPGAILYTPSGTSVYGSTSAPVTTGSEVTLRGVTALPVASNQAQSVTQVLPRPVYRVVVTPISDQNQANEIAGSLSQAGFGAKVDKTTSGQYTVILTPPPQATVSQGLAVIKSVGADLPIKIELGP